jgi:hypothetical protein
MPLRLNAAQWRLVLRWFVRGMSSAQIAHETGLDRKRVLRALLVVRRRMRALAPAGLLSAPAPEEEESAELPSGGESSAGRQRVPVLAIYASHAQFWGDVVPEDSVTRVARAIRERGSEGLELPGLAAYTAVVYRRRLYRLSEASERGSATQFGQVEAFWSYLQRQLRSKGGIRRSRLDLYLAEYAWRYNQRKLTPDQQVRALMLLVRRAPRGVANGAYPLTTSSSLRHVAH